VLQGGGQKLEQSANECADGGWGYVYRDHHDGMAEYDKLILEFSKLGLFSKPLYISVAFEVAAQLRHPAAVPARRQGSTSAKKALAPGKNRSQKKDRSRKKRGRKKG
jgi:hypothetical protein